MPNIIVGRDTVRNALGLASNLAGLQIQRLSLLVKIPPSTRANRPDVVGLLHDCHVMGKIRPDLHRVQTGELHGLLFRREIQAVSGLHRDLPHLVLHPKVFRGRLSLLSGLFCLFFIHFVPAATCGQNRGEKYGPDLRAFPRILGRLAQHIVPVGARGMGNAPKMRCPQQE